MNGWRLGSLEYPREPHFETHGLLAGRHLFRGGRNLYDRCKTPVQLVAEHWVFERLRAWIVSLRPYPTLFLFAVPLVALEPVKPIAAYLLGTGHVAMGIFVLVVGEILKLMLVERLFGISRDKLMSIPTFAWAYWKYRTAKDWIVSAEAWQTVRRWTLIAQYAVRKYSWELNAFQRSRRITFQSR